MLVPLNFQGQIPVIRGPPFCGASFLSLVQLMGEKQPAIWGHGGGGGVQTVSWARIFWYILVTRDKA